MYFCLDKERCTYTCHVFHACWNFGLLLVTLTNVLLVVLLRQGTNQFIHLKVQIIKSYIHYVHCFFQVTGFSQGASSSSEESSLQTSSISMSFLSYQMLFFVKGARISFIVQKVRQFIFYRILRPQQRVSFRFSSLGWCPRLSIAVSMPFLCYL